MSVAAAARIRDEAMRAFIDTITGLRASAPTWCAGWSAQDLIAHIAAGDAECAELIESHRPGQPDRSTRGWTEREAPYLAMTYEKLCDSVITNAVRLEGALDAMGEDDTIEFTGWAVTARMLRTHSRSEVALHRWDLVGDDDTSRALLSEPRLTAHVISLFAAIPYLDEARRWAPDPAFITRAL